MFLRRCCQKVHLVADNLGWFEDQPTNVETLHGDKVKKVHDHAAISAFLKSILRRINLLKPEKSKMSKPLNKTLAQRKRIEQAIRKNINVFNDFCYLLIFRYSKLKYIFKFQ